jgi:uncharacterized protein
MTLLGLLLGLIVGLTMGLLGGGGSVLTVPIFVMVLGIEQKLGVAMALAVVGATSLFGAWGHYRAGNIHTRTALAFGGFAMAGSFIGGRLSHYLSGDVQLAIFGAVMLVAAVFMFRGGEDESAGGKVNLDGARIALIAGPAVGVGLLTGLISVGGGFLIVPTLVLLAKIPMRKAIGSSLLVIGMTAAAGFAEHLTHPLGIQWGFMASFTAVAICGILLGARLVPHIPQATLRRAFALFLVFMALFILYQKRTVFMGRS